MRAVTVALLLFVCCVFTQNTVSGRGCFNGGTNIADASFSCALQFFATGMEGKSVSLKVFDASGTSTSEDVAFDGEKAVVEFSATIHRTLPSCLAVEKIEATFKAPYAITAIDKLVLESFEGEDPRTQDARGQCFKVEQRAVRRRFFRPITTVSEYGSVYVDLWCAFKQSKPPKPAGTPEQITFKQLSSLQSGC